MNHLLPGFPPYGEQQQPPFYMGSSSPSANSSHSGSVIIHQHYYPQDSTNTAAVVQQLLEYNRTLAERVTQLELENQELKKRITYMTSGPQDPYMTEIQNTYTEPFGGFFEPLS